MIDGTFHHIISVSIKHVHIQTTFRIAISSPLNTEELLIISPHPYVHHNLSSFFIGPSACVLMMKLLIALQLLVLSATSVLSQSIAELAASLPDFSILVDLVSIDDPVIEPVLARITGSQPTSKSNHEAEVSLIYRSQPSCNCDISCICSSQRSL